MNRQIELLHGKNMPIAFYFLDSIRNDLRQLKQIYLSISSSKEEHSSLGHSISIIEIFFINHLTSKHEIKISRPWTDQINSLFPTR